MEAVFSLMHVLGRDLDPPSFEHCLDQFHRGCGGGGLGFGVGVMDGKGFEGDTQVRGQVADVSECVDRAVNGVGADHVYQVPLMCKQGGRIILGKQAPA